MMFLSFLAQCWNGSFNNCSSIIINPELSTNRIVFFKELIRAALRYTTIQETFLSLR